jgi:glycosyltransferase involved in cell wall biosynthesis
MSLKDIDFFPKISIITPSYNQVEYLETTILSVLDQNYPNLEYIIIDGGSTDGSVEIIKKYSPKITYWISEKDYGQSNAINKGIAMATGEWIAWQNSDDIFYPNSFLGLKKASEKHPSANLLIANMMMIDSKGYNIRNIFYVKPTLGSLLAEGMVLTNQSAFWRRSIHEKIGFLNENLHYAFDYEWFLRVTSLGNAYHVNSIWGGWRIHDEAKASLHPKKFKLEFQNVISTYEYSKWLKWLYFLRRMLLLIFQGKMKYLTRGIVRRIFKY